MPRIEFSEEDRRKITEWHDRLPEFLYRYVGLIGERRGWLEASVKNSTLYLPSYRMLNDPFDGSAWVDFAAPEEMIRKHWRDRLPADTPDLEVGIDSAVRAASDPAAQKVMVAGLLEANSKYGVGCFTERPDDLLMWSYYAEGHAGLCLKYRAMALFDSILEHGGMLVPVAYEAKYPTPAFYTSDTVDFVHALIGTKAEQWRHEAEWRVVLRKRSGLIALGATALAGIVMGCRVTEEDRKFVLGLGKAGKAEIQLLRAVKREREYGMQIESV